MKDSAHRVSYIAGRAIAQAVSLWFPTSAALVRAQVRSCGICVWRSGTEAGFLLVLQFPLPILISPTAPHSLSSTIRGWYNRSNSGRSIKWTQSHPTPRTKNWLHRHVNGIEWVSKTDESGSTSSGKPHRRIIECKTIVSSLYRAVQWGIGFVLYGSHWLNRGPIWVFWTSALAKQHFAE
jgi:hypothetical protein